MTWLSKIVLHLLFFKDNQCPMVRNMIVSENSRAWVPDLSMTFLNF